MKTFLSCIVVIATVMVIILALMHGMVSEVEIRELKADRMAFNQILADKALAERSAVRDVLRPTSHVPRVSR